MKSSNSRILSSPVAPISCPLLNPFSRHLYAERVFWAEGRLDLVAKSFLTLAISWTVVHQAPLSMGFFRQEHWSGLPFPSPGDLPHPGVESMSPTLQMVACIAGRSFITELSGMALKSCPLLKPYHSHLYPKESLAWGKIEVLYGKTQDYEL